MSTNPVTGPDDEGDIMEFTLTDIRKSKIITVSAKIAQPEYLALERLSQACRASKSMIIREALRVYVMSLVERSPALSSVVGGELISELYGEDGTASLLERCLSRSALNGRP
ncbi:MAG: hypothetical protein ACP5HK_00430 [Acidilobus sp.]